MPLNNELLTALHSQRIELGPAAKATEAGPWQHWRLVWADSSGNEQGSGEKSLPGNGSVVWLVLDRADASVNSLNEAVLEELDSIVEQLEQTPPSLLVLRSGKASGFCVGADVGMFRGMDSAPEVSWRLKRAHAIVDRLEKLPVTKLAVLHGPCLGGGLELALACDLRIAIEGAKLGFPEVLLGLHPGLGGSFRSTDLINPITAMTLMLTGKSLSASRATAAGLVDAVTQERHVINAVAAAAAGSLQQARQSRFASLLAASLRHSGWLRARVAKRMLAATGKKVSRRHYPAPFALIGLWQQHGGNRTAMQAGEIESFASLVTSATGQNLIRIFFLREALKQGSGSTDRIDPIRHVHVVGAGTMGGDIAAWCAFSGLRVSLSDTDPTMLANAVGRAAALCRRRHRSRAQNRDILDRLIPDCTGDGIAGADLIIEAVPEAIDIKNAVYRDIQARMKPGALLATNTSSIPLETLRAEIRDPGRFVGLHFFNPVSSMQLVELVSHDQVGTAALDRARVFINDIDRLSVPVRSSPGFLVNRVLTPYLLEAMLLLDEGVAAATLDRVAMDFGMPMGPVELADRVGLDICLAVADTLEEQLAGAMPAVPSWIREKVKNGETGRKAGRGFYSWRENGDPVKGDAAEPPAGTADRLLLPLLNTCVTCLREGIVTDEDTLDAAMIFGTGFAPFTGGPLHYARSRGPADILAALETLAQSQGDRFRADPGWQDLQAVSPR